MDGIFFHDVNFWLEVHKAFGTLEEGKILTEKYLHTDYAKLVEEVVVKLWKGRDATPYFDLVNSIEYIDGVPEMMARVHELGYQTAIVSASSIDVARRVQKDYGIDQLFANELVIRDGKVAGEFHWPIGQGRAEKKKIVQDISHATGVPLEEIIFIGDSGNDVEAFAIVGRSITFNPTKEEVRQAADYVVEGTRIDAIIPHLE